MAVATLGDERANPELLAFLWRLAKWLGFATALAGEASYSPASDEDGRRLLDAIDTRAAFPEYRDWSTFDMIGR